MSSSSGVVVRQTPELYDNGPSMSPMPATWKRVMQQADDAFIRRSMQLAGGYAGHQLTDHNYFADADRLERRQRKMTAFPASLPDDNDNDSGVDPAAPSHRVGPLTHRFHQASYDEPMPRSAALEGSRHWFDASEEGDAAAAQQRTRARGIPSPRSPKKVIAFGSFASPLPPPGSGGAGDLSSPSIMRRPTNAGAGHSSSAARIAGMQLRTPPPPPSAYAQRLETMPLFGGAAERPFVPREILPAAGAGGGGGGSGSRRW